METRTLLIACGALAKELVALQRLNEWSHLKIQCLPAELHNTPEHIPGEVAAMIEANRDAYPRIFVAYADCGTGGQLDRVLAQYGVSRIPGAHCYEFFAGHDVFTALADEEPGTFYLTDFLVRHFDRLVIETLGLDRHPELMSQYFGNYRRLVYLAQSPSDALAEKARECARYLGLDYVERDTGLGPLQTMLNEQVIEWRN